MTPLLPAGPENTGRRAPALAFAVVAVICIGVVAALGFSRGGAAHRVGSGVVVIDTNLGYEGSAAAGTGMVLSPSGEVLTNNHVIKGATTIRIVVPATGRSYAAKVVGYDVSDDVAVLQAQNASNLKTIPLGDSSRLALGQAVTALGNAGGTGSLTKATGTVTGLGKTISASDGSENGETLSGLVETDADVQPGDSGGPLLNEAGEAIGMNTAASTGTPFAAETAPDAYAIPIDKALAIARQIGSGKASATVHIGGTPFLGVELESVGSGYDYGDAYGYGGYGATATSGALIASVVPSGAADSAGLEAGDVITAIDGRSVTSPSTVTSILLTKRPGTTLRVDYVDAYGTTHTASVTLGSGPAQ